jgi:hypothetical protein
MYGALLKRLNLDALMHTRAEVALVRILVLPAFWMAYKWRLGTLFRGVCTA